MDLTSLFSRRREWDWGLILSYDFFPVSFFETQLLGNLSVKRNLSIVIDGRNYEEILRSPTQAPNHLGVYYNLEKVRVRGGGCFHPKLYLFVSDTACSLALGSHNLTENGFKKNVESAAVFSFDLDGLSHDEASFLSQIRSFLRNALVDGNELLEQVSPNLSRTVSQITEAPFFVSVGEHAASLPGGERDPMFLSSLRGGIWQQIQGALGDAFERVEVLSPFFDDDLGCFREVVRASTDVEVYVPAERSNFPKEALSADPSLRNSLSISAVSKTEDSINRPVHAKLYRFTAAGSSWRFCGSPNFTNPGFLSDRFPRNLEIGVMFRDTTGRDFLAGSGLSVVPVTDLAELKTEPLPDTPPTDGDGDRGVMPIDSAFYSDGKVSLVVRPGALADRRASDLQASLVLDHMPEGEYDLCEEGAVYAFSPTLEIDGSQIIQVGLLSRQGDYESPLVFVNRDEHDPNLLPALGASTFSKCVRLGGVDGIRLAFELARDSGRDDWMMYLLTHWDLERILRGAQTAGDGHDDGETTPTLAPPRKRNYDSGRLKKNISAVLADCHEEVYQNLRDFAFSLRETSAKARLHDYNEFCMPLLLVVSRVFKTVLAGEERKKRENPSIVYPEYTWLYNYRKYTRFMELGYSEVTHWLPRLSREPADADDRFIFCANSVLWLMATHTRRTLQHFTADRPAFHHGLVQTLPSHLAGAISRTSVEVVNEMEQTFNDYGLRTELLLGEELGLELATDGSKWHR